MKKLPEGSREGCGKLPGRKAFPESFPRGLPGASREDERMSVGHLPGRTGSFPRGLPGASVAGRRSNWNERGQNMQFKCEPLHVAAEWKAKDN